MGCERASDGEALSDYLLALRGVLDAVDEAGQPTLARRLAALCAEAENRDYLISRVEAALNLELALIAGVPIDAWSPPRGIRSGRELVAEMEEHLRALLRDVVCGYLKPELASMADEILLRGSEPAPVPIHTGAAAHPLDAPTTVARAYEPEPPAQRVHEPQPVAEHALEPRTEVSLPPEHRSPVRAAVHEVREAPHRERHQGREFSSIALVPPEAEPKVTRLVDVINATSPQRPAPAPVRHEQPALVVDDFAWDLDDPGDYSAPV
jgi:hypothetical protein